MDQFDFDRRPVLVAVAGSNGAGKSTFVQAHLAAAGLRAVNADEIAAELSLDPYSAARLADSIRRDLVQRRESFLFETVLSDPHGDKVDFLAAAAAAGYNVVVCALLLNDPEQSAMRVSQGGHDVPREKIVARFPRTLANVRRAIERLPCVLVYDQSDLRRPYRLMASYRQGRLVHSSPPLKEWLWTTPLAE